MTGLRLEDISHAFDGHAVVRDVSVSVTPGELVCLLGPSGCGKTTLLRVAAGLEQLQRGRVAIGETVVAEGGGREMAPERRGIGLMFQDYALFPHLTVTANIAFGVAKDDAARRRWIAEALARMDLARYADAYPHILSGGQQQRVALLRALAPRPRVLLLDEPFSGLDVTRRAAVRQQTLDLLKDQAVATLMVTHDPEEAMFMADRILVMADGRIVQDGTPVDVYFHPADAFVTHLFGPVNRLTGEVRDSHVATAVGTFDAPGLADGTAVEILIRPEALRLAEAGDDPALHAGDTPCRPAAPAVVGGEVPALQSVDLGCATPAVTLTVVGARPLGQSSHLHLAFAGDDGAPALEARVPGVFLPQPGARVAVSVNVRQVHVFPRR